jgi:hypothetical protein
LEFFEEVDWMKGIQPTRWIACVCVTVALMSALPRSHPHDEFEIFIVRGTLTKVDAVNRAIELDIVDPKTKTTRNMLLFVEAKAKLRNGRARMTLAELKPGQRVRCEVERNHKEDGSERLMAFDIRLETRS